MKLFISWSGPRSQLVAKALHQWIPAVLQSVEAFMSSEDIMKGSRWSQQVSENLASTDFGIICLTPENQQQPWLLFEAGALSKSLDSASVATFLLDMTTSDVKDPLAQFQDTKTDSEDVFKLLDALNRRLPAPLTQSRLTKLFDALWPELDEKLTAALKKVVTKPTRRSEREVLDEVLDRVRSFERIVAPVAFGSGHLIGVDRIVPQWDELDWEGYLQHAVEIDVLFRDGNPWREQNDAILRVLSQREGVRLRVVLPDPNDDAVLQQTDRAHNFGLDQARERIQRCIDGFRLLRDVADTRAQIEIYASRDAPLYAWCRMDAVGMFRPYAHGRRPPMPAFVLSESGSLFQICQADFEMLAERSAPVG